MNIKFKDKKIADNPARYSAIPTFVIDSQHKVLYWNKACEELTGVRASEVAGTDNHWKAFFESRRLCLADIVINKEFNEQSEHYTKSGRPECISSDLHYETCIPDMGGKKRYIVFDAAPICNSKGKLFGALETLQDITAQKHAEQLTKRKLNIEKVMVAIASMFVGPIDIDVAIETALDEIGRLCGASRSYVFLHRENEPVMDNTHEWCNEGVKPQKEKLQNLPDDMYQWWMSRLHNDGIIHIHEVSLMPAEASVEKEILEMQDIRSLIVLPLYLAGELTGFIGMDNVVNSGEWKDDEISALQMVSSVLGMAMERKRSEEELRAAHQKLFDIIEFLPDATFVIDSEKKVIAWNRAIEEMTGVKKKDIIGKGDYAYAIPFYGERRPILIDLLSVPDNKIKQKYNYVEKRRNALLAETDETLISSVYGGKGAHLWVVASPLFDSGGIRIGAIESIRDITDRKRVENNLKKYTEELQDSNELKDLFTDILHHDLLNPAGIVKGYTEILYAMEKNEKKCHYLQTIERNNEKLISIIERASKFAKLQTVKELNFKTMDIGAVFKEVIGNFMPKIDEKKMTVEFNVNGRYCANVNPVIEEVFANLLSNAIKYGPENSRIIIDIIDAGEEWKVTVTDFGEGISDENKSMLFERFRRVSRKNVKGTGLGLAIVKRLINLHGGSVGVEDNPEGQGSRFWVTVKKA